MSRALQAAAYVVTWTSFLVATTSCILRCCCCAYVKRNWKADDSMSLVVGVFLLGSLGLWQRNLSMGCAGPEPNTCNYSDPSGNALTWLFVTDIYFAVLQFVLRAAFFTFYLQFSAQSNFRFWIGMGFGMDVMLLVANLLLIVFQCDPITAAFRPTERMIAHCMDAGFMQLTPAVLNALLNLYTLILPLPIFYWIQMPIRRKLCICCVFTIGGAAVLLGLIRLHSLRILISNTHTSEGVGEMMIEGALGMSLAALAYNLPSIRVLWTHVLKSRSKTKGTSYHPCDMDSRKKSQPSTTYGIGSAPYGIGSFSRPVQPTLSLTSLMDRPCPSLPAEAHAEIPGRPRYPVVDLDFGTRPRAPPSVC